MKGCPSPPQIVRWRWPKNVRVRTAEIQTVSNKSYMVQDVLPNAYQLSELCTEKHSYKTGECQQWKC